MTLVDFAVELENIAHNLRFAGQDKYYDPHGVTYAQDIMKFVKDWLKAVNPSYRKSFLDYVSDYSAENKETK